MPPVSNRPNNRLIVGTSLKMYFDLPNTASYIQSVSSLSKLASSHDIDLFVIPDFVSLLSARDILKDTPVLLGAQDTFWEDKGAYTGEISPIVLRQVGVRIVEIGHAERRKIFGESNEQVGLKCAAAVRNGLIPLVCIGEKTKISGAASAAVGAAIEECKVQVKAVLDSVPEDAELILAYEPVWAIGASEPAGADHVVNVVKGIRSLIGNRKGTTRVLYGGSAGPGTFNKLKDGVDGLFLGRFAHDVGNLEKVIMEMSGE
jgi:triosephosphate isomerase